LSIFEFLLALYAIVAGLGVSLLVRSIGQMIEARERLLGEPVVLDGLRTFAGGQYWVLEITNLLGSRSTFSHDFVVTERRRSGAKTEAQIALDLLARLDGQRPARFAAAATRAEMGGVFTDNVHEPEAEATLTSEVEYVTL